MNTEKRGLIVLAWVLQILAAFIMGQTLFFKFSASVESVYIFETLGVEPWGRIASGVAELLAVLLLLWPRSSVFGAVLGAGVMLGAIASHLAILGVVVMDDGGLLFTLACVVLLSCLGIIGLRRDQLLAVYKRCFSVA